MSNAKSTVLIADDYPAVAQKVSDLLSSHCEIVGTVNDGLSVVEAAKRLQPKVIIMDIAMPFMSGIQAAREIRKAGVNSKIVFLTAHADADYVTSAFESGAAGYVLKLRMNTDLVVAVREVLSGRVFSSPNGVPHKAFKTSSSQPAQLVVG